MSLQNLLELNELNQDPLGLRTNSSSRNSRPQPKPRLKKLGEVYSSPHKSKVFEENVPPKPKPRRKSGLESDSTTSGDDNTAKIRTRPRPHDAYYDNPVFLSDDGGSSISSYQKSPRAMKKEKNVGAKSMSHWYEGGDTTTLFVEKELHKSTLDSRKLYDRKDSIKSLTSSIHSNSNASSPKAVKKDKEKDHVKIIIEEQEKEVTVTKTKSKGSIWQRLLRSTPNPNTDKTSDKEIKDSHAEPEILPVEKVAQFEGSDTSEHSRTSSPPPPRRKEATNKDAKDSKKSKELKKQGHKVEIGGGDGGKKVLESDDKMSSLFSVIIHRTDLLPLDPHVIHPVVKVTLLTQDGKFVRRTGTTVSKKEGKSKRREKPDEIIDPVMTQPFKLELNPFSPSLIPRWEELLLFDEPYEELLQRNPGLIMFFEVADFLPMNKTDLISDGIHGSEIGWYKLAWGFLRNPRHNSGTMLRLNLMKPVKLWRKEVLDGPEIFSWYKSGRAETLCSTLYVTVKAVRPPSPTAAFSLRQLLSLRKGELTDVVLEELLQRNEKGRRNRKKEHKSVEDLRKTACWSKLEGQNCKVPNKLYAQLPSSPVDTLDLTITGNVHCVKFSPCGLKLAAGLDSDEIHSLLIFEMPSGKLVRTLKCHFGLIYELSWKELDQDDTSYTQYLASASADSTVCIHQMQNNDATTLRLIKVLHHPSFVFTVQFHPTHPSLVATGCFDFVIRVWNIHKVNEGDVGGGKSTVQSYSPIFILDRHCSFVNCLAFDRNGDCMFSGDGDGTLFKWRVGSSPSKKASWVVEKEAKVGDIGQRVAVNSLSVHPKGMRLLVHLRNNSLKILDTSSLLLMKTITGLHNDRQQIRSCFSPCGNLILSGSENAKLHVWDADTYTIVETIVPPSHPRCSIACVDYHPKDFYVSLGLVSMTEEPRPILLYSYALPTMSSIALAQAGALKFKSNLRNASSKSSSLEAESKKGVTFGATAKRAPSSEKFLSIIDKLDSVLKEVQESGNVREQGADASRTNLHKHADFDKGATGDSKPERYCSGTTAEKSKAKSPRSRIEEKLEELIIPQTNRGGTSTSSVINTLTVTERHETIVEKRRQDTNATSATATKVRAERLIDEGQRVSGGAGRLMQPRPHSSKIPVRVVTPASEGTRSGSTSAPTSPVQRVPWDLSMK